MALVSNFQTEVIGHLTAQKLHSTPTYYQCPAVGNTNCPNCYNYNDPFIGPVNCHVTLYDAYATCIVTTSGTCMNRFEYPCYGVQNSRSDCSGQDFPGNPCSKASMFITCKIYK